MSTYRAILVTLAVLVLALAATGLASLTAWARCGPGDDCSTELALAAADAVPVAIIGSSLLILVRTRAAGRMLRTALLAAAVGVAVLPIAAFLMRELWAVVLFGFLVACLVALVVSADREPTTPGEAMALWLGMENSGPASTADGAGAEETAARALSSADAEDLCAVVDGALEATIRVRDLCADLARIGEALLSSRLALSGRLVHVPPSSTGVRTPS
jgi:hypothetical protein